MIQPYYESKLGKLYHGDCLEIMPMLEPVDLVLTDPPYGVSLGATGSGQERDKCQNKYDSFKDDCEYISSVVVEAINLALSKTNRMIVTPGNRNAFLYPKPDDIGVWYNPAGTGRGKWGFILAHLIFYYGKDPFAGRCATASSTSGCNDPVWKIKNKKHPCPKPLKFMSWLLQRGSRQEECVLDPFIGSGTTAVACERLGRKWIGIEISEKYCEVAARRIEAEASQLKMF